MVTFNANIFSLFLERLALAIFLKRLLYHEYQLGEETQHLAIIVDMQCSNVLESLVHSN